MVFESLTSLVWSLVIDRTHAMVLLGPWGTTAISLRLQAYLEMSIGCMLITGYTVFLDHDIVFIVFNFNTPEVFLQNGPFQRPTQKTTYSTAKKSRPLRPKRHSQSRFEWPSPPLLQHQRALERPKKMGSLSDIWCRYLTTLHLKLVEPIWSNWNWKNQWNITMIYTTTVIYNQVAEIVVNPKDQFIMDPCIKRPAYKSNHKQPMGAFLGALVSTNRNPGAWSDIAKGFNQTHDVLHARIEEVLTSDTPFDRRGVDGGTSRNLPNWKPYKPPVIPNRTLRGCPAKLHIL